MGFFVGRTNRCAFKRFFLPWVRSSVPYSVAGAVLVEAAVAIPLLLLILAGGYTLVTALQRYRTLAQIAFEGARYAVSLEELEIGTLSTSDSLNSISLSVTCDGSTTTCQSQARVHRRVAYLLKLLKVRTGLDPAEFPVSITSLFYSIIPAGNLPQNAQPLAADAEAAVMVRLQSQMQGFLGYVSIPLSATVTLPYLVNRDLEGGSSSSQQSSAVASSASASPTPKDIPTIAGPYDWTGGY